MIGLDILTWGTEGESNPYRYPIYHYLWGGSIGHAALKLTLPSDAYHDALILEHCNSASGKSVIPHYKYRGNWIVYFSWWPGDLQEEYEDRIEANSFLHLEYEALRRPYFTDTILPKDGFLRYQFPALYDWWFGAPTAIPKPIEVIVHPHPLAKKLTQALHALENIVLQKEKEISPLVEQYIKLHTKLEFLEFKRNQINLFCKDETKQDSYLQECIRKYKKVTSLVTLLEKELQPLLVECDSLTAELTALKRRYYHDVATVGVVPQQVHIALGNEISPVKLLAKMREIADGEFPFDKILYNCSTVVREVVAAGLADSVKTSDCSPHLFDTPLKIHRFACQLQQKLLNLRLEQVTMSQVKMYLPQYHGHEKQTHEAHLTAQKSLSPRPF